MPKLNRYELLQNEFIEWLLLDKHQRAVANLPSSEMEWAKVKDVSDRTLRNWKQDDSFIAKYENRQREQALSLPGATTLALKPSANGVKDDDTVEYAQIKQKLVERAKQGDRASAELYFKTYGKMFVDEEIASRRSDFRDLDTDALYDRVLALVPVEKIEAELAKRKSVPVPGDGSQ
jgi:urease gamma subunit